ncbi:unnamed protein product, partial [Hymenolepis diminuta]
TIWPLAVSFGFLGFEIKQKLQFQRQPSAFETFELLKPFHSANPSLTSISQLSRENACVWRFQLVVFDQSVSTMMTLSAQYLPRNRTTHPLLLPLQKLSNLNTTRQFMPCYQHEAPNLEIVSHNVWWNA